MGTKYKEPKSISEAVDGIIGPDLLHNLLRSAATIEYDFPSEKRMQSYRRMLYTVNKQGRYRYRTMRSETAMWGLVIWRMR